MSPPTAVERTVGRCPGCGSHPALKPGDLIEGKYVLRKRIGEGGMGCVFLADQVALGRSVAIKVLEPEFLGVPALVRKMHEEAMVAAHVRSPHCVRVFDCSALPDGTPYIVMEYVPGLPLGRVIASEAVPVERALDLFGQILDVLAAAHRSGIVHGDVKSDNFLIEHVGGVDHVTMIDFGLARVLGPSSEAEADVASNELLICGTPEYMAPELVAGDPPLPASDLYGAGVILYELLTGTTPFQGGNPIEIMARQGRDAVIPPSERAPDRGIPWEIDRVVLAALDKRPGARFPDAAVFARELKAAAAAARASTSQIVVRKEGDAPARSVAIARMPGVRCPVARGSDCSGAKHGDTETLRRTIGAALRRGDVTAIADGYLELASAFVECGKVARATSELQEGIDVLTAGGDPCARDTPPCVDRLIVALAALYDDAGDPKHARRLAMSTDGSPTWTCAIG